MKAVDARLLKSGRPARVYVVIAVLLGIARALLLIAQAWLLATAIAGAFVDGKDLADLKRPIALLALVLALRAFVAWASETSADRCSARVKSTLRAALVERIAVPGVDGQVVDRSGRLTALVVKGVDALDGYFSRFVPQMFLAVIVPVAILAAVASADWVSAAIIAVTLPLIPVFMALIGWATRAHNERQLHALQLLSGHFLDVVAGLTTLKTFGRSTAQVTTIGEVTHHYRRRVMATLRLTFLSSLALELIASVSVALVAVAVGLRLLDGRIGLRSALFVLVLAPEAYLPLRQLGADFHASGEGRAAAEQVFEILDRPLPARGTSTRVPDPATVPVSLDGVTVVYPGRDRPALDEVTLAIEPGQVLAITGPSGCGKSTLIAVLLGLVQPDSGHVRVGNLDLAGLEPGAWRAHIAWVPQRPHLFASTLGDNIRLGRPGASAPEVLGAVGAAGLTELVARLPRGLDTPLGENGAALSAGERQRLALARAFVRDAPFLLLDEPTANLDGETESGIVETLRHLARGRTVVMAVHRPALLALADRVVDLTLSKVAA